MTNLIILYVAAILVPLLFASWRVAVVGLGMQGLVLSIILVIGHGFNSAANIVEFLSLFLIRAVFVPWYLFRMSGRKDQPADFSLAGKSLTHRSLVLLLLGIGFVMGYVMDRQNPKEAIQIGAALSSFLLGMLMIANQKQPMAQLIGLFTFEGGVTLVELLSSHAMPFPVQLGVSAIDVLFVLTCGEYLTRFQTLAWESDTLPGKELR